MCFIITYIYWRTFYLAVTGVRWNGEANAWDIHVLSNNIKSPPLDQILIIDQESGKSVYATSPPPGVNVEFIEEFVGGPTNFGVTVDRAKGTVLVAFALPPGPHLKNFIIRAKVTDTNITSGAKNTFETFIRIHIHDGINRVWLTPSPLTLHRDTKGIRFSVFAELNDNTIGVIPPISGVTWSSNSTDIDIDAKTGEISPAGAANSAEITATLPPSLGSLSTKSQVVIVDKWSKPTTVNLIEGNRSKIEGKLNVLFIPDGFISGEEALFSKMVREIVHNLNTSKVTIPFETLSDSINYWSVFIPSRERGISELYDMNIITRRGGKLVADDKIPFPEKPNKEAGQPWTLEELVYRVGMPVPADKNIDPSNLEKEFKLKLANEWKPLFGTDVEDHVNKDIYDKWQKLSNHKIANEKDTALGLGTGSHANISLNEIPPRLISWHPFRTTRLQLDEFLSNLTYRGSAIGTVWKTGKSREFVVALCAGCKYAGGRSNGSSPLIASGLRNETEVMLKQVTGSSEINIQPYPIPEHIVAETFARFAHECAHSFNIGDEYGKGEDIISTAEIREGNIQHRDSLISASLIDGNKIKWLWPRISKAGVLISNPVATSSGSGLFTIKLRANQSRLFKKGDIARLRQAELLKNPQLSDEVKIVNIVDDDLQISTTGGFTPGDYPSGSIIFTHVYLPSAVGTNTKLLLVAPNILEQINVSHGPLNAPAATPARACEEMDEYDRNWQTKDIQIPTNLSKALLKGYPFLSKIVGLYEGGRGHRSGIYHPRVVCLVDRPCLLSSLFN